MVIPSIIFITINTADTRVDMDRVSSNLLLSMFFFGALFYCGTDVPTFLRTKDGYFLDGNSGIFFIIFGLHFWVSITL